MGLPDYYQILGVASSASVEEIKKAYRKRAFENHPDRGGSLAFAVVLFYAPD